MRRRHKLRSAVCCSIQRGINHTGHSGLLRQLDDVIAKAGPDNSKFIQRGIWVEAIVVERANHRALCKRTEVSTLEGGAMRSRCKWCEWQVCRKGGVAWLTFEPDGQVEASLAAAANVILPASICGTNQGSTEGTEDGMMHEQS